MWLITSIGFFSIVQKPDDIGKGTLTVRARAKSDLETLRSIYLPNLGEIVAHAGTDYCYRAKAPQLEMSAALSMLISNIDYDNFKNQVKKTQGNARANIYHEVWHALYNIEDPHSSNRNRGNTHAA